MIKHNEYICRLIDFYVFVCYSKFHFCIQNGLDAKLKITWKSLTQFENLFIQFKCPRSKINWIRWIWGGFLHHFLNLAQIKRFMLTAHLWFHSFFFFQSNATFHFIQLQFDWYSTPWSTSQKFNTWLLSLYRITRSKIRENYDYFSVKSVGKTQISCGFFLILLCWLINCVLWWLYNDFDNFIFVVSFFSRKNYVHLRQFNVDGIQQQEKLEQTLRWLVHPKKKAKPTNDSGDCD